MFVSSVWFVCLALVLYGAWKLLRISRCDSRLPPGMHSLSAVEQEKKLSVNPGPPTLPIVGNEHLIPKFNAHFMYLWKFITGYAHN